ncbi:Hypothetical protein T32B20.b [Arabidopsis thaliana]|uniref:Uncharacterized protein T32B20.b n=1 Tax=Arabidopsis thaliana TaxID=3702 RepID=Q9LKT7_ARATH|nr:Hypothetical protein T32B20.b [Arabidopsis thaliana]
MLFASVSTASSALTVSASTATGGAIPTAVVRVAFGISGGWLEPRGSVLEDPARKMAAKYGSFSAR